jgi:uncharacterized protein YecE (DUF72 family)
MPGSNVYFEGRGGSLELRIGTSGWHYKHWKGLFYPAKLPASKMLEWYVQHFDTVEINNTFYRLPNPEPLAKWRESVPPSFLFATKASRFITHMKKLRDPENAIEIFFDRIRILEPKLGPILFQLPPHWPVNLERLDQFLSYIPRGFTYVVEFREPSWCVPEIYSVLRRHNVALCLHDWGSSKWPMEITADFTYVRMHGPTGAYHGKYDDAMLREWAGRIQRWQRSLSAVYIYFNNDVGGHAISNAVELKQMLEGKKMTKIAS